MDIDEVEHSRCRAHHAATEIHFGLHSTDSEGLA